MRIRLGTRQSPLALWQANHIATQLQEHGHQVELVKITTSGDISSTPLEKSGGVGVFTKEIQRALLDDRCDLAVHSLKDLPTEAVPGLSLAAIPRREEAADCFLSEQIPSPSELPSGARIGTGSPRRRAQIKRLYPEVELLDIRGNVDTRIRKMKEGSYDGIVLAYAGLHRLQLKDQIVHQFSLEEMIPAVAQAALGLETRSDDPVLLDAIIPLDHRETHLCVSLERSLLRTLRAGCLAPLAAHARFDNEYLRLSARVFSEDYSEMIEEHWKWTVDRNARIEKAESLGMEAAHDLCELGADEMIRR